MATEPPTSTVARELVEKRHVSQLLVDLVLDPRDPGYAAAALRHGPNRVRQWYERPVVALGCLVIGFVLAVSWSYTHRGAPAAAKLHDRLVQRVRTAEGAGDQLATMEAKLTGELDQLRTAALPGSSALLRDLARSQLVAGAVAATGPGLEVRLAEPKASTSPSSVPGRGDRTPASGGHILTDRDVRSVVNQLWAGGAEAIAVNGMRLTPTSAIRFAGDVVLVDLQPIESPYVIDAIGNTDELATNFAASDVASRYQTLAGAKGIGFSFQEKNKLSVPASPVGTLHYAHVVTAPR